MEAIVYIRPWFKASIYFGKKVSDRTLPSVLAFYPPLAIKLLVTPLLNALAFNSKSNKNSHLAPVVRRLDKAIHQAPVVRKVVNSIHRINHYPTDSMVCFLDTYPLDSDLSGG